MIKWKLDIEINTEIDENKGFFRFQEKINNLSFDGIIEKYGTLWRAMGYARNLQESNIGMGENPIIAIGNYLNLMRSKKKKVKK